jgi:hypothetical protein
MTIICKFEKNIISYHFYYFGMIIFSIIFSDQPSKSVEKSPKRFSARKSVKESLANVKAKLSQIEQSIHRELGSSQSDNKVRLFQVSAKTFI